MKKILILPGDGIGPEIINEAVKVLDALRANHGLDAELEQGLLGGAAYRSGTPSSAPSARNGACWACARR